jgi:hypothetical protein
MTYQFNCVSSDAETIGPMVDQAKEITYRTFLRYVSFRHLSELFPWYDRHPRQGGLMLCHDWHVAYFKSKVYINGELKPCVFVVHSGIEYVFTH